MNPSGNPGRDDSGLPPAHIDIPDDARELARDVLAYRRELRVRRRRERLRQLLAAMPVGGGARRRGMIVPLVAAVVALAMLAVALLSMFAISSSSGPDRTRPATSPSRSAPAHPSGRH